MPDLDFQIDGVEAVPYAALPQLAFKLRVADDGQPPAAVHSVMLRCQVRLEPGRRRYATGEQEQLHELFGEPQRWGQTVRSTLWTNLTATVPPFTGTTRFDLIVPCTYDFNVAATKYFAALADGDVPLSFLFSGTIFYVGEDGPLQVEQISWEKEATFRLPVAVWRQMMEMYYPNVAWLCLRQDVFDRLNRFKVGRAMHSIEQAIEVLLDAADAPRAAEVSR